MNHQKVCVWEGGGHLPRNQKNKTGNSPYLLNHPNSNHLKPRFLCQFYWYLMDTKTRCLRRCFVLRGKGGGYNKSSLTQSLLWPGSLSTYYRLPLPQISGKDIVYRYKKKCRYLKGKKGGEPATPPHSILMLPAWNRVARKYDLGVFWTRSDHPTDLYVLHDIK